ncbi:MAG: LysR family transcriptional regulator [Myxococcales bacterium]|nr:LysR family transcriptional regulator [Myxococcales bacterium]
MPTQFDWSRLAVLLAVHRAGSAREAAKRLGVHSATVYRSIRALEEELGALLFERRSRGYAITAAGEELLALAERIESEAGAVAERLSLRQRDWVQVSLPGDAFATLIAPALRTALAAEPGLVFRVEGSDRNRSIADHETDIAIRVTRDPPLAALGRRVGHVATAIYGSKEVVQRASDAAPESLSWISWVGESYVRERSSDPFWSRVPDRVQVPNHSVALAMAAAGCGFVAMACAVGDPWPGLIRCPASKRDGERDLWVLVHEDARRIPTVQSAARALSGALFQQRTLLEGGAAR